MSNTVLWGLLNVTVWTFGLRAALDLRREFAAGARTWTLLAWAVGTCLAMDVAMIGHALTDDVGFAVLSATSGVLSAILMWLTVRFLLLDLSAGRALPMTARSMQVLGVSGIGLLASLLVLRTMPAAAARVTAVLHPVEGALWILGSIAAIVGLTRHRYSATDLAVFRPRNLTIAFGAALFHAVLTPLSWLTGRQWSEGVGTLAGTLFILTMVTTLYGTLLRLRGQRLADAERHVHEVQEQLFSVEKLVAIGTLAAGAAHDFNNSLMVISGSAQMALDDPSLQGDARRDVESVLAAAADAAQISANLMRLSRRQVTKGQGNIKDAVLSSLNAIHKDLTKRRILVETRCDSVISTTADPSVVAQVCLNLYLNARDAMEATGGGTLTVSIAQNSATSAGDVSINVTDTGTGIPEEFLPRLFKPLQTTKGDKGTGLGLAGSRAMLHALGGQLTFETQVGRGTTFTIRLPGAPGQPSGDSRPGDVSS